MLKEKETMRFSGKGAIYSWTKVFDRVTPEFEYQIPYYIALIKLKEGPVITAQLTDFGEKEPEIGMEVEMVTRKLSQDGDKGLITYGYKFRPPLSNPEKEAQALG